MTSDLESKSPARGGVICAWDRSRVQGSTIYILRPGGPTVRVWGTPSLHIFPFVDRPESMETANV